MHAANTITQPLFDRLPTHDFRPTESLTEKYRPRKLRQLVGQDKVVAALTRFAACPYSHAFLLSGATGTGKSSAGMALANELGVVSGPAMYSLGGLHTVASGSQGVDEVRSLLAELHSIPFYGSGWRCVIANEVDCMTKAAEPIWLDFLESIPPRVVIVFSTNAPEKLSQRFKDRCDCLTFESGKTPEITDAARQLIRRVCEGETGSPDAVKPQDVPGIVADGAVSFRRLVQNLGKVLRERAAMGEMAGAQ